MLFATIVSASLLRRHEQFATMPFVGVKIADGRLRREVREEMAARIVHSQPCCRGIFWDRLMKQVVPPPTPADLFSPLWTDIILGWAMGLEDVLSIAKIERRNRRSRTLLSSANAGLKFENFVSLSLLREFLLVAEDSLADDVQRVLQVRHATAQEELKKPSKPKRGVSPFEHFLKECFQEGRRQGEAMHVVGFSRGWRRFGALVAGVVLRHTHLSEPPRRPLEKP